jgi:hypothetical protein
MIYKLWVVLKYTYVLIPRRRLVLEKLTAIQLPNERRGRGGEKERENTCHGIQKVQYHVHKNLPLNQTNLVHHIVSLKIHFNWHQQPLKFLAVSHLDLN